MSGGEVADPNQGADDSQIGASVVKRVESPRTWHGSAAHAEGLLGQGRG